MQPLTKEQVIQHLKAHNVLDITSQKGTIVKAICYSNNPMAPETYMYKVFYTCPYSGNRDKFAYYPNTVGRQYLK